MSFLSRIKTRREVASLKELTNLLEHYKADLLSGQLGRAATASLRA
jgi:hypothetical protein